MTQSAAEAALGRILTGLHARLDEVRYDDLLAIARRTRTENTPQVKEALDVLRRRERSAA
jgi:hypothetical protein